MRKPVRTFTVILSLLVTSSFFGNVWGQSFSDLVGDVSPQPVKPSDPLSVPYITWGGDVATFYANGGLQTQPGTIYKDQGLNLKLTPGDDFVQQVKDYLTGASPFLRGTYRMLGQASEVLNASADTKPVVVMQLSWSAGDHIVSRKELKKLNDLRGKNGQKIKIACQQGGPHVGLLYDSLETAGIAYDEVDIVWVSDLTGADGPAEKFRSDPTIAACCVITPDMLGLTGGLDTVGTGAEGTVAGAHVLNSTAQMSRSIADVYAVRSDWYKAHRDTVEKFVAGYLKATEQVLAMRRNFESSQKLNDDYKGVLQMSQTIFGKEVIPTLEVDAHGLLLDCSFVGLPGQMAFFEDPGNLNGFAPKMKAALDMATAWGYAKNRLGFDPPQFDYEKIAKLAGIKFERPQGTRSSIAEDFDFSPDAELDDKTIVSFTINFEPNQSEFSADQYGAEFMRAIKAASTFGNAVVVIRGHSDPTRTLRELVKAGVEKGLMKRVGTSGNYRYTLNGRPLDTNSIDTIVDLVKTGKFEGTAHKPAETMQAALNLSHDRATAVRGSLVEFAEEQKVNLDASQIQPVGAGIVEPVIPRPRSLAEAKENMRVEFRIVRVPAEALNESDFDF